MKSVCPFSTTSIRSARKLPAFHSQSGQASVFLLVILGTFLLASVGFAVDLSSMWFHRQAAQSAADSACAAGAMDMLYLQNGTMTSSPGFIVGTSGAIRRRPLALPVCGI